jgi:hypothetical protein
MGCGGVSSVVDEDNERRRHEGFRCRSVRRDRSEPVSQLVACGHTVGGTTRSAAKTGALGAEPVIVDALHPDSVAGVVAKAEPEVIVHELTALSGPADFRHAKRMAAATDRLRTEGTDHLLAAARAVGVGRLVAQSNALWMERTGGPAVDGNGRIEPNPPADAASSVAALRHVEDAGTGITWAPATSPMTSRHRWPTGCRTWPACSAPTRRAGYRPGSSGWWPARRRWS